jgi:hypothetical protein
MGQKLQATSHFSVCEALLETLNTELGTPHFWFSQHPNLSLELHLAATLTAWTAPPGLLAPERETLELNLTKQGSVAEARRWAERTAGGEPCIVLLRDAHGVQLQNFRQPAGDMLSRLPRLYQVGWFGLFAIYFFAGVSGGSPFALRTLHCVENSTALTLQSSTAMCLVSLL